MLLEISFVFSSGIHFIMRINAETKKQTAFVMIIGHSERNIPNAVHSAKPATVTVYMLLEMAAVSPVWTIFHTWGTKLVIEHTDARYPTTSAQSMFLSRAGFRAEAHVVPRGSRLCRLPPCLQAASAFAPASAILVRSASVRASSSRVCARSFSALLFPSSCAHRRNVPYRVIS